MSKRKGDHLPQETEDAMVNIVLERLLEKGAYRELMGRLSAGDRKRVEDSADRHAARQRAAGEKGW